MKLAALIIALIILAGIVSVVVALLSPQVKREIDDMIARENPSWQTEE